MTIVNSSKLIARRREFINFTHLFDFHIGPGFISRIALATGSPAIRENRVLVHCG
jgi:hypothetical protein